MMFKSDSREAVRAFSIKISYIHCNLCLSIVLSKDVTCVVVLMMCGVVRETDCELGSLVNGEGLEFPDFVRSLSKI